MADKLDKSYAKHLKILSNAMNMITDKTSGLIHRNRQLQALLARHGIQDVGQEDIDEDDALRVAIANIKESLDLLKERESHNNLKDLGTWFQVKIPKK